MLIFQAVHQKTSMFSSHQSQEGIQVYRHFLRIEGCGGVGVVAFISSKLSPNQNPRTSSKKPRRVTHSETNIAPERFRECNPLHLSRLSVGLCSPRMPLLHSFSFPLKVIIIIIIIIINNSISPKTIQPTAGITYNPNYPLLPPNL